MNSTILNEYNVKRIGDNITIYTYIFYWLCLISLILFTILFGCNCTILCNYIIHENLEYGKGNTSLMMLTKKVNLLLFNDLENFKIR